MILRPNASTPFLLLFAALAGACSPVDEAATVQYAYAWVSSDCAPWDGAATQVYLTDAPYDSAFQAGAHLSLSVWRSVTALGSGRIELDPMEAAARRCDASASCETATGGWIRFAESADHAPARGDFSLRFGSGTIAGRFDARWLERQVLCG